MTLTVPELVPGDGLQKTAVPSPWRIAHGPFRKIFSLATLLSSNAVPEQPNPGNHIAGGLKIRTQRLTHSLRNTGRLQDVRPRYEQNRLAWKEGVRKRIGNKANLGGRSKPANEGRLKTGQRS